MIDSITPISQRSATQCAEGDGFGVRNGKKGQGKILKPSTEAGAF